MLEVGGNDTTSDFVHNKDVRVLNNWHTLSSCCSLVNSHFTSQLCCSGSDVSI